MAQMRKCIENFVTCVSSYYVASILHILLNPHKIPARYLYIAHLTDEEKLQRGSVTCPGLCSLEIINPDPELRVQRLEPQESMAFISTSMNLVSANRGLFERLENGYDFETRKLAPQDPADPLSCVCPRELSVTTEFCVPTIQDGSHRPHVRSER